MLSEFSVRRMTLQTGGLEKGSEQRLRQKERERQKERQQRERKATQERGDSMGLEVLHLRQQ